jgi:hypothetical protein
MTRRPALARSIARRPPSSDIQTVYPYKKKTHTRVFVSSPFDRLDSSIDRFHASNARGESGFSSSARRRVPGAFIFMTYGYVVLMVIKKLGRAETPVTAERDGRDDR